MEHRIGHGWDLHRLEPPPPHGQGRAFRLGGISIEHPTGPVGHSDGDALLHAITDALLGAVGAPDIGQLFPDSDPAHDGADSAIFLARALAYIRESGWSIGNLDATIVCQTPKIGPVADEITRHLATLLDCGPERLNLKGKTHEGVDAVGEGRAIEVHVVALLQRPNS
ncbi:MAG: 2-C-methyl-D-erythritol 2,4-cyclodiphosphate synthase [Phycisphaerales bacterium]|nr:2-C-methyl-D-erythritol 2,4-cyclodiphosphate synthase [Phycisphaerales bacterium]